MKKLTMFLILGVFLGLSTYAFALNTAEQRYGLVNRQSVAMTVRYLVTSTYCTMTIDTLGISISGVAGADVGFADGNRMLWSSTTNDADFSKTIGNVVTQINKIPYLEAKIVDAMNGDTVMYLGFCSASVINSEAINVYFKDLEDASTTNTPSFQQIRIHTIPGEKVTLKKVYVNGDTGNLMIYKGDVEIWREQVTATVVVTSLGNTWTAGPVYTTLKTDGSVEFENGIDAAFKASSVSKPDGAKYEGSEDITIRFDNVNIADTWATTEYLNAYYERSTLNTR